MRCGMFCAEHWRMDPMIQMTEATLSDPARPSQSARAPAKIAPTKEPAGIEAVMPPCWTESGSLKYSRYCSEPIQADMEEISKPKIMPPMVPRAARTVECIHQYGISR